MLTLRRIGNDFRIRHHEVDRIQPPDALVDYLFARIGPWLSRGTVQHSASHTGGCTRGAEILSLRELP